MSETVSVAGVDVSPDHFIGGERVASETTFTDLSPIDEQPLAEIARGGPREAGLAVAAATEAFPAWAALGAAGRAVYLHRLADLIDANVERLAPVECVDMAMLLRSLKARLINRGARNYRSYADLAAAYEERVWASNGTANRVIRMPSGPAVVITPWNAPFMLSTWKTAPALAAGSTVILKPAEWSPLSCSLLADLVDEAGFPPGVFNIVQGIGEEIGAALVAHPGVRRDLVHRLARDGPADRRCGRSEHRPVHRRARRQGAAARVRGQRSRSGRAEGRGPVRRRGPGVPRGDADARPGIGRRAVPRALPPVHRRARARRPPRRRHDRDAADPSRALRAGRRVRRARARATETRSSAAATPPSAVASSTSRPSSIPRSNESEIVQREVFGPVLTFQTFADEAEGVEP